MSPGRDNEPKQNRCTDSVIVWLIAGVMQGCLVALGAERADFHAGWERSWKAKEERLFFEPIKDWKVARRGLIQWEEAETNDKGKQRHMETTLEIDLTRLGILGCWFVAELNQWASEWCVMFFIYFSAKRTRPQKKETSWTFGPLEITISLILTLVIFQTYIQPRTPAATWQFPRSPRLNKSNHECGMAEYSCKTLNPNISAVVKIEWLYAKLEHWTSLQNVLFSTLPTCLKRHHTPPTPQDHPNDLNWTRLIPPIATMDPFCCVNPQNVQCLGLKSHCCRRAIVPSWHCTSARRSKMNRSSQCCPRPIVVDFCNTCTRLPWWCCRHNSWTPIAIHKVGRREIVSIECKTTTHVPTVCGFGWRPTFPTVAVYKQPVWTRRRSTPGIGSNVNLGSRGMLRCRPTRWHRSMICIR